MVVTVAAMVVGGGVAGAQLGGNNHSATTHSARLNPNYPCQYTWTFYVGPTVDVPKNHVVDSMSVACFTPRHRLRNPTGSLSLTVGLQTWNAATHTWRTQLSKSHTWTDLRAIYTLTLEPACKVAKYHATYDSTLRNAQGHQIAKLHVTSPSINVTSLPCRTPGGFGAGN